MDAEVFGVGDDAETPDSTPDIALAKSERLNLEEASAVMRAAPTRVIGIIGPTSSGKTSMIASLCDLFQQGQDVMPFDVVTHWMTEDPFNRDLVMMVEVDSSRHPEILSALLGTLGHRSDPLRSPNSGVVRMS